jgi:hypothetical protein
MGSDLESHYPNTSIISIKKFQSEAKLLQPISTKENAIHAQTAVNVAPEMVDIIFSIILETSIEIPARRRVFNYLYFFVNSIRTARGKYIIIAIIARIIRAPPCIWVKDPIRQRRIK